MDAEAPPASITFTAEDDLALREAMEAGWTADAAARGAVQFSQPYTAADLRARWLAMLYDPVVAREAAPRMIAAERARAAALVATPRTALTLDEDAAAIREHCRRLQSQRQPPRAAGADDDGGDSDCGGGFSDVEAAVLDMPLPPGDLAAEAVELGRKPHDGGAATESDTPEPQPGAIAARRAASTARLARVRPLEAAASAATTRALEASHALAALEGRRCRLLITKEEVSLGRFTEESRVDVDLGLEGNANKVSRQQAFLKLRRDGRFWLRNVGRRAVAVNARTLEAGQRCPLPHNSLVEVGGLRFLFVQNHARTGVDGAGAHCSAAMTVARTAAAHVKLLGAVDGEGRPA